MFSGYTVVVCYLVVIVCLVVTMFVRWFGGVSVFSGYTVVVCYLVVVVVCLVVTL